MNTFSLLALQNTRDKLHDFPQYWQTQKRQKKPRPHFPTLYAVHLVTPVQHCIGPPIHVCVHVCMFMQMTHLKHTKLSLI